MRSEEKKSIRVWSNVTPEINEELKLECKRRGLSKGTLIREFIMMSKNYNNH